MDGRYRCAMAPIDGYIIDDGYVRAWLMGNFDAAQLAP